MNLDREGVPLTVSVLFDGRPVRWSAPRGDYDGRERTLDVFDVGAGDQRALLRALRPLRASMQSATGGPVVVVFHTPAETERLYSEVVDERRRSEAARRRELNARVAEQVAAWIDEPASGEPPVTAADIEPLTLREAA